MAEIVNHETAYVFVILFGLVIGSFLSVCIYRLPLNRVKGCSSMDEPELFTERPQKDGRSITIMFPPRSICAECKTQLRWYHNIPFFSWVLLGGKCAFCRAPISMRYPMIELITAACALLSFHLYGATATALVVFILAAALIVISYIDLDYYIIPDVISIPGTVIGVLLAAANDYGRFFSFPLATGVVHSLLGIATGAGFLLFISYFYTFLRRKSGLGLGDVKLLAMTGAFLGWEASLYTIIVGSLLGSILGVLLLMIQRKGMSSPIPFGPYLAGGTLLYMFTGLSLLRWTQQHLGLFRGL